MPSIQCWASVWLEHNVDAWKTCLVMSEGWDHQGVVGEWLGTVSINFGGSMPENRGRKQGFRGVKRRANFDDAAFLVIGCKTTVYWKLKINKGRPYGDGTRKISF